MEVYDPVAGEWSVAGDLAQGRDALHAIADVDKGRVLFPGGFLPAGPEAYLALPTCDLASSGGVVAAPNLISARELHAVAFAAGKFVVSGGWGASSTVLDDAEVWDGTAARWMPAGVMPAGPRASHTMTTLANGREVLVVGGCLPDRAMTEVDIFDAAASCWRSAPPTHVAHCGHAAVRLLDGRVLVAGGDRYSPIGAETTVEIFDPGASTWATAAPLNEGRFDHDMTVLPDGRVLVVGGSSDPANGESGALSSVELYDPVADTWTTISPMHDRRRWPTLAVLSDGVYVAGGSNFDSTNGTVLSTVERLGWSDLGITGPIELDAGVPGGYPTDASASCGSTVVDAGRDGSGQSTREDAARRDANPDERGTEPVGPKGGCSCMFTSGTSDSAVALAFMLVAWAFLRRRSVRVQAALPSAQSPSITYRRYL